MATPHNPKSKIQNLKSADLLFEIGTEELPAAYLPSLIEQLGRQAETLLSSNHLACTRVQSFGTPRRLVLIVERLAGIQRKPAVEVRGPSKQAAYDKEGKPTQALLGFLRSQGGSIQQVKVVSGEKGEYVYLLKPPTTTPAVQVLPELLPQLIGSLRAPKTMRWDATGVRFARPIRWLCALYGAVPVRCAFGTLASAPTTWVGHPLRPKRLPVRSADQYVSTLRQAGVQLDQRERRRRIEGLVNRIAKRSGGRPAEETASHGLLEEVTDLVEQPVELAGAFDPKYLELPREVLLASMAKYQRVFAIEGKDGRLLPMFVAILEGKPGKPNAVRAVVERILNARLADSLMFWNEDRTIPLDRREIAGINFHERLGSMKEKTQRCVQLQTVLAEAWHLTTEERSALDRACRLAKADLVTNMVKEFPTLQGIMGKHYALAGGESRDVAMAIEEHYLPLAGKMPKTITGSALAVADKYDTLASYFSVGIEPTGDQDPFGLRRAAQGIVEVAWAVHRTLPFRRLFDAWAGTSRIDEARRDKLAGHIRQYLLERLYTFSWPDPVPAADCIEAVLASPCEDLVDVMDRIVSLRTLEGNPALRKAAKVIERTRNILRGAPSGLAHVDPSRFQEALENGLWERLSSRDAQRVVELAERRSYADATVLFGNLFYDPLHEFFDRVLVNGPDQAIQRNRLALMRAINTLYTDRIADLSKLTLLQREES